eukprot:65004-Rhodomonas_salina.1
MLKSFQCAYCEPEAVPAGYAAAISENGQLASSESASGPGSEPHDRIRVVGFGMRNALLRG